jgi:lipoprotein-anchoring transpeptidase ErfK/SrfK
MHIARKVTLVLTAGVLGLATAAPAFAAGAAGSQGQALAALQQKAVAHTAPATNARTVESVSAIRPITGRQTFLPVVGHATDGVGDAWLKVLLPGRPNSHTGWIPAASVRITETPWRIAVDLSARRVTVFRNGHRDRSFRAVVGKPSTPTPQGHFFVEEMVRLGGGAIGAPAALALSARSNVLQQFEGGPGQIALHGTGNVGGRPGTAVSHGCMRLRNHAILWLAAHIVGGSPVDIRR